ncbi:hypothetical protein EXM22_15205 [Oceanispirochaeta crateris]|uniref:Uncharacterized protein n=1 Tax=Oceanispirochaeta crateris TaxID=2518645 RepID=A0A5C1QQL7_9SPIO|nr:outer membrane beta-barrel protein [Oceanispirochaeta crateris]QEN09260.1 hypothetical protein EXM22_15205 [Oceanispirochaeta crateris]
MTKKSRRRGLLFLCLIFTTIAPLAADESIKVHMVTNMGFDPLSRYQNISSGTGFSLGQEAYISLGDKLQIGAGGQYLLPREISGEGRLGWQPIYLAMKLFFPQKDLPFYLKGSAGYTFIQGDSSFMAGKTDLEGGLYYLLGAGVDLPFFYTDSVRFSLVLDMAYASFSGSVKQNGSDESIQYTTMNMSAGIGMRF